MLRRRRSPDPPADPAEERFAAARATVAEHAQSALTSATLGDVERALRVALEDRRALQAAIDGLDAESSTRDLKAALRARPNPMADDTDEIAALRRRHHAFHRLLTQRDQLTRRIDTIVVDTEAMAATAIGASIGGDQGALEQDLALLRRDLEALERGHRTIEALEGTE